jgi:hypothetical protein
VLCVPRYLPFATVASALDAMNTSVDFRVALIERHFSRWNAITSGGVLFSSLYVSGLGFG